MTTPYRLNITESCSTCRLKERTAVRDMAPDALQSLECVSNTIAYPGGAVLFVEGQKPTGIFLLCEGRVKLSIISTAGKTAIIRIAEPGEAVGLSAAMSNTPYELNAETLEPSHVKFVPIQPFLELVKQNADLCFRLVEQLSEKYGAACRQMRGFCIEPAGQRLANLLLQWVATRPKRSTRVELSLTHDEMAQRIGTSRATVTRLLAKLRKQRIVERQSTTLVIRDEAALSRLGPNHSR